MELINGRTTGEVRRYDLFKLIVAVALMINWLFFWAGPLPESWGSPPAAPGTGSLFPTYTSYSRPAAAAAPSVSGTVMPPPSRPARLAVSWRDGRLVLEGFVRDESTRQQLLETAARVAGQADRVDDRLRIEAGAPGYDWLPNLGSVLTGFGGPTPAGIDLDGQQVALTGEVADQAERDGRLKAAGALFGPGITVVDRLTLRNVAGGDGSSAGSPSGSPAGGPPTGGPPTAGTAASDAAAGGGTAGTAGGSSAAGGSAAGGGAAGGSAASGSAATTATGTAGTAVTGTIMAAPAPAPAPAPDAPLTRLYFGVGSAFLPRDAAALLAPSVEYARANPSAVLSISGYHDRSGPAELNHELARHRAQKVRDALVAAGVAAERIRLDKPVVTDGGSDLREARRVEVSVAR